MEKFLMFNEQATANTIGDAVHDVYTVPLSSLVGFTNQTTTSTTMEMVFKGMDDPNDTAVANARDKVTLTITDNMHVKVIEDIMDLINKPHNNMVVIGDANTGTFASKHITGIAITVVAGN